MVRMMSNITDAIVADGLDLSGDLVGRDSWPVKTFCANNFESVSLRSS